MVQERQRYCERDGIRRLNCEDLEEIDRGDIVLARKCYAGQLKTK